MPLVWLWRDAREIDPAVIGLRLKNKARKHGTSGLASRDLSAVYLIDRRTDGLTTWAYMSMNEGINSEKIGGSLYYLTKKK